MKELVITGGSLLVVLIFVFVAFLSFGDNIEGQAIDRTLDTLRIDLDSLAVDLDSLKVQDITLLRDVESNTSRLNLLSRQLGELSLQTIETENKIEGLEAALDTIK